MTKAIFAGIILLAAVTIFGISFLLIKLWSGKPFQSIWADRNQLFLFSLKLAVAILNASALALVIVNN
jgi:hypothetical protein